MIVESYCCNAIIAILIFWIQVSLKEKYKNHIGFIFLFGSGTKFLMFFVIFYAPFKLDGEIIIYEFISYSVYNLSNFFWKLTNSVKTAQ